MLENQCSSHPHENQHAHTERRQTLDNKQQCTMTTIPSSILLLMMVQEQQAKMNKKGQRHYQVISNNNEPQIIPSSSIGCLMQLLYC